MTTKLIIKIVFLEIAKIKKMNLSLFWVALGSSWGHFWHIGVTLNDFGLTLDPLCDHLLTLVGPSWAYKQLITENVHGTRATGVF